MPTGILYIINHRTGREGSEFDEKNLESTFKEMNCETIPVINPGDDDLKKIRNEFATKDYTDYKYVAVAWMSHGSENEISNITATKSVSIQKEVLIPLCNNSKLNGKLKLLIIQACKGKYDFLRMQAEGDPKPIVKFPNYYVKLFATSEGTYAYRYATCGSIFIVELCKALREGFRNSNLNEIMNNTVKAVENYNLSIKKENETEGKKIIQRPCMEGNLHELLFDFNKGTIKPVNKN